jgi:uncharacterized membrane-anchored protein YitT (DUF2179 family)
MAFVFAFAFAYESCPDTCHAFSLGRDDLATASSIAIVRRRLRRRAMRDRGVTPAPATGARLPAAAGSNPLAHTVLEDVYGLIAGVLFAAIGIAMLKAAGLVTGGVAGISLLVSYVVSASVGTLFMAINLPFFLFAYLFMGWRFTLKSILGSVLIMGILKLIPHVFVLGYVHPAFAALIGGTLCGMGVLAFARHGAGMGGTGIVTMWLSKRYGINPGRSQLAIDCVILLVSLTAVPPALVGWSALSGIALSAMMMTWHKPGRYECS